MPPDCDPRNCPGHAPMEMNVKVNSAKMNVFGLATLGLLAWLLSVAYSSGEEIKAHKAVASSRYSHVEVEISKLVGEIKIANNNFEYVKEDMSDDIKDLKELIKSQNKSWANAPLDTSALRFPYE